MNRVVTLAGIPLKLKETEDGFEFALGKHEFPARDGALVENMGRKCRPIRLQAWFTGEAYEHHRTLLDLLKDGAGPFEFVHPAYGTLSVFVEKCMVKHDRKRTTAVCDMTLIETIDPPDLSYNVDVEAEAEAAFVEAQAQAETQAAADIAEALGPDGASLAAEELDPDKSVLEQLVDAAGEVREFAKSVDSAIASVEAEFNAIMQPLDSLVSTIEFATSLPGRVLGAVTNAVERVSAAYESIRNAPARFMSSLSNGLDDLKAAVDDFGGSGGGAAGQAARDLVKRQISVAGAATAALQLGYIFAEDEAARQKVRADEGTQAFDAEGNYMGGDSQPLLDVRECERALEAARLLVQTGLDDARAVSALKDMARTLTEHVVRSKFELARVVTVRVDTPTPLILVCHRQELPYRMARRVLALNDLRDPNNVSGEVDIYNG